MSTAALTPNAFRRLGKPKGATYWLIRHALSYSVDDMDNRSPDVLDSPAAPLFSRLALSHRLALLADLAQGLLLPNTPLPPDTLEHHAAFLYLFTFAYGHIEACEDEEEWDSGEEEGHEDDQAGAASYYSQDLESWARMTAPRWRCSCAVRWRQQRPCWRRLTRRMRLRGSRSDAADVLHVKQMVPQDPSLAHGVTKG